MLRIVMIGFAKFAVNIGNQITRNKKRGNVSAINPRVSSFVITCYLFPLFDGVSVVIPILPRTRRTFRSIPILVYKTACVAIVVPVA